LRSALQQPLRRSGKRRRGLFAPKIPPFKGNFLIDHIAKRERLTISLCYHLVLAIFRWHKLESIAQIVTS
jgi:hypothetical protein